MNDIAAEPKITQSIGDLSVLIVDPAMHALYALLRRYGRGDIPVLIHGETGTGKELAAAAIHYSSARSRHSLVSLNCATLAPDLFESTLFGHTKGAFTSAHSEKPGLLEEADGGTLFLDEIAELPVASQAKLLRALETGRFARVGSTKERVVSVRIIAASNRDLLADAETGLFRKDLYYRLAAATAHIPPLRERLREIPALAHYFLASFCDTMQRETPRLSGEALRLLQAHRWPGNVRELRNLMLNLTTTVLDPEIQGEQILTRIHIPLSAPIRESVHFRPLSQEIEELERLRLKQAMEVTRGNQTQVAKLLSISVRTVYNKLRDYGLDKTQFSVKPQEPR